MFACHKVAYLASDLFEPFNQPFPALVLGHVISLDGLCNLEHPSGGRDVGVSVKCDDPWLDVEGSPLTKSGKMTELFRRVNYGNMEIEVTVDDAKAYTKSWTVKVNHRIMLDTDLIEFVCQENEKDAVHLTGK